MILFTLVVAAAIYAFSWKMRSNSLLTSFDWRGWKNPPPLQGGTWTRTRPRGVAPGWHAPRRWRVIVAAFSSGENCYEAICKIASSHRSHCHQRRLLFMRPEQRTQIVAVRRPHV